MSSFSLLASRTRFWGFLCGVEWLGLDVSALGGHCYQSSVLSVRCAELSHHFIQAAYRASTSYTHGCGHSCLIVVDVPGILVLEEVKSISSLFLNRKHDCAKTLYVFLYYYLIS